ncbi:MAG TPA: protein kinase [Vicinamibacterales bacterium]|nr:protein kinase [Vicinamibacterales bacterium]
MQCTACGATSGPSATACARCGIPFDPGATGVAAISPRGVADADATRLIDSDATRLGSLPAMPGTATLGAIPSADDLTIAHTPTRGSTRIDADVTMAHTPGGAPASATGPLAVGAAFGGRYHIIRMLGMGGMGAVYQAWDAELEVALALKVVRPAAADDPEAAAEIERRFKQELLLARLVTHPNVVRIHDLGEVDGIKYITMPYIHGTDLAGILAEKGKLPVRESLLIARQIAAGLRAAHEAGVVHRDLKPANIMIDAEGHALITDFGIARTSTGAGGPSGPVRPAGLPGRLTDGHTVAGTIVGSIEYMAPEQARGEAVDQRADVYAWGLMLYRMLVGRQAAATGAEMLASLRARMEAEPAKLRTIDRTIPEAVEALVSKCLQPDPAARFATSADLVTALNRLDENGVPIPLPVQLLKSARFWAAAAIAAIAIVTTTWVIADRPEPPTPDPIAVLVANFTNKTGEPVFDGLIEPAVTVGIEGASFITAYPRPAAERVGRRINAGTRLDESTSRLVAISEGIKVVLLGSVEKRGSGYTLSMQGVDPTSRKVLFTSKADARDRDAVLKASGTLAARVREALGDTRTADPRETLSTASLDAVSAYTRAQELSSAGKDQEAIEFFRKATSIDPSFGRAYGGMAMSATRLGRKDEAAKLWQEALKHVSVMSEREQYRLLGAYYMLVTRNIETARDTYEKLVKQYPADGAGHNNLAVSYFAARQFDKAMNEGRLARKIYPTNALYRSNYALYSMYAGNFAAAAEEASGLIADGLASYDTYLPLAISAIANGQPDAARDAYQRMAAADATGASLAATGLADLALAEGRAADAIAILQAGIKADQAQQNLAGITAKETALADAYGMQGNIKAAVAASGRALKLDRTEIQVLPAVRWLIAANQLNEAERLGAALEQNLEPRVRAYGRIVAAQVALARGKRVEAVDAMREALKLADLWLVRFHLGQAYLAAGAPAEAFSEFETCIKRRGEGYAVFLDDVPTARAVAPVNYWMGRAREGMGLTAQALTEYRAYVAGRAKDSPEPLLKDAIARMAKLE